MAERRVVLVTGGRDFMDRDLVFATLDRVLEAGPIDLLVHGACPKGGADLLAHNWAYERGITVQSFPVDHKLDGPWPAAGPRRNRRMILMSMPTGAVAFPGGKGTDDCVDALTQMGVKVFDRRAYVEARYPRTPDGYINNCQMAWSGKELDNEGRACQICNGRCPDRVRLTAEGRAL